MAAPLTVSITFDDGYASATQAAAMLEARGMRGTFFVIGGYLGHPGYLTPAQARALEAAGHEVGGHTVSHRHLLTLSLDEAQREICDDRASLTSYGLHPQSFAYPFGEFNASGESLVGQCGYNSGRIVGPITDEGEPAAETIPPLDPFAVRTPWSVEDTTTVSEIEGWVTAAEATGGWLHLVFHKLCQDGASCDQYSTTVTTFGAVLDWLAARAAQGTVVRLEREVIGGPLRPLVAIANPVMNPSLEATTGGVPDGWQRSSSGSNTATWSATSDAHAGGSAQRVDISSYTSGARYLLPKLSVFGPPGLPGHRYLISGWYKSSAPPRWTAYFRDHNGVWSWWTQSTLLPASASWTQSTFTTPTLPSNATGLAFGFSLGSLGSLTVDDFGMNDLGMAPTEIALTSPLNGASVQGTVTLTASATSPSGITRVDFFVGGSLLGSVAAPPYALPWNTASSADGLVAVSASAIDGTGATVSTPTAQVTVTNGSGLVRNPSLESDVGPADGVPDCWTRAGFGTNTATWTTTTDSHAGARAQRVDVTSYTDGALRLVPTQDSGACAPAGSPGHSYRITAWYKSSAQPRWVAYHRSASGSWVWWAQSSLLSTAQAWTRSTWTTPALPAGATAISFGLSLYSAGSLTVDDFTLFDTAP